MRRQQLLAFRRFSRWQTRPNDAGIRTAGPDGAGGARQAEQMLGSPARGCVRVPDALYTHTRSLSARIWGLKLQPVQPRGGQEPRERKDAVKAALSLHHPRRWCAPCGASATPGPPGHRAPSPEAPSRFHHRSTPALPPPCPSWPPSCPPEGPPRTVKAPPGPAPAQMTLQGWPSCAGDLFPPSLSSCLALEVRLPCQGT